MVALLQRGIISLFIGLSTVATSHTTNTINHNPQTDTVTTVVETSLPAVTNPPLVAAQSVTPVVMDKSVVEFNQQIKHKRVASIQYWERVAHCETHGNWKDKGNYAGGLGIYIGTWKAYGGTEFASTPYKATKIEQIVVANRISIFGYQTKNQFLTVEDREKNRPFFRYPVGFTGWGCVKNYIGKPQKKDLAHRKKNQAING